MISEDDDRIVLEPNSLEPPVQPRIEAVDDRPAPAERTLILGCSPRLPVVLRELDAYAVNGSETWIVGQGDPDASSPTSTASFST